ncbi:PREDICTED: calmodulin-binding receptor-like cytoplasmic kinase 2 [Camelina sativa]|uniref:Calmodulin-binding receptor-like cytoplasmic kinase 2 n=1 Tax=Camelina sativa TaxID=90675 RepID=A0ABM0TID7_CAMSA|nr:PREDICTED: calmodulin-binding receptor-like cytoplasmic kinase 2 [Camelina sativa]XP_010426864.1 PREDICTED: calmodulin-binding receptor-like cytoplasmic kinase 2 [Camelina sativa]
MTRRRSHSYTGGSSPAPTASSSYSITSSITTDRSFPTPTDKSTSSVASWISGIFINCFTPPDSVSSKDFNDSKSSSSEHNRRSSTGSTQRHNNGNASETEHPRFTFHEIYDATKNFSPSFRIGQGGFGTVYKVKLRDGTTFAVKRAKKSMHDDRQGAEFKSEIQTLAQVTHLSLVKYYGYVVHDDEKILIVEYVANGTLRDHLDCKEGKEVLDMATRLDIATDVAHAITYLHMYTQPPIIHRDIKSSNILLTENFRAKVADFGFARLAPDTESGATHVSTQVKGTAGYLDPEYLTTYQLTEKSDVYSFGVLLVEILTGRRPIELSRGQKERITIRWAIKKFTSGDTISVLDPKLEQSPANNLALEKVLEMAFQCLAPHRGSRPSMKKCSEILWGIRKDYRELLNTTSL